MMVSSSATWPDRREERGPPARTENRDGKPVRHREVGLRLVNYRRAVGGGVARTRKGHCKRV